MDGEQSNKVQIKLVKPGKISVNYGEMNVLLDPYTQQEWDEKVSVSVFIEEYTLSWLPEDMYEIQN